MKWKRKKLFSLFILLILLHPATGTTHPGSKDKDGGHICRKNCEKYGLESGQYHRHKPGTFEILAEVEPEQKTDNQERVENGQSGTDRSIFTLFNGIVSIILSLLAFLLFTACVQLFRWVKRFFGWSVNSLNKLLKPPTKNKSE